MKQIFLVLVTLPLVWFISCQSEKIDPEVDCSTSDLEINFETENATCGLSDGSVTLTATGGTGVYTFSLAGSDEQESGHFEGLAAGNYQASVTDENGCSAIMQVSIGNTEGVEISSISKQDAGCNESNGSITVTATSGAEPYQYKLGSGDFQESNAFAGLATGNHVIVVKDAEGCEFSETVELLSGVSYDNDISPIIGNNCAVSGCHNGDNASLPNFTVFSNVQSRAGSIRSMTSSGQMPPAGAGTLSENEKDLIACWVADGALNN